MVDYDARRGLSYKPNDAPLIDSTEGRLVFAPAMDITAAQSRTSFFNGTYEEDWLALAKQAVPGLTDAPLTTKPAGDKASRPWRCEHAVSTS